MKKAAGPGFGCGFGFGFGFGFGRGIGRGLTHPRQVVLGGLIAAALLFAQWLGLAHGLAHVPAMLAQAAAGGPASAGPGPGEDSGAPLVFGHRGEDSAQCRLLDHTTSCGLVMPALVGTDPPAGAEARSPVPLAGYSPAGITTVRSRGPPAPASLA